MDAWAVVVRKWLWLPRECSLAVKYGFYQTQRINKFNWIDIIVTIIYDIYNRFVITTIMSCWCHRHIVILYVCIVYIHFFYFMKKIAPIQIQLGHKRNWLWSQYFTIFSSRKLSFSSNCFEQDQEYLLNFCAGIIFANSLFDNKVAWMPGGQISNWLPLSWAKL